MYGLSGKDYRVATLPKLYLTVIGIIMQDLKSIGKLTYLNTKWANYSERPDPYYKKASLLKSWWKMRNLEIWAHHIFKEVTL